MSPFEFLGIGPDVDERAIKRAYAGKLRQYRPEEDPEGFQQLHAAYRIALQHRSDNVQPEARRAATAPEEAAAATCTLPMAPSPPAIATDASIDAAPVPHLPDLRRLFDDIVAKACSVTSDEFERWLYDRPEFLSLNAKEEAGRIVVGMLFEQSPPMPADALDAVLDFFNCATVDAMLDPLAVASLQVRLNLRWELLANNRADYLARRHRVRAGAFAKTEFSAWTKRMVSTPWRPWEAWLSALLPGRIDRVSHFLKSLDGGRIDRLPPEIDHRAVDFWLAAAERGSLTSTAIRSVPWLIAIAVLLFAIRDGGEYLPSSDVQSILAVFAFACGCYLALLAWRALRRWLIRPEFVGERFRAARLLALPAATPLPPLLAKLAHPSLAAAAAAFFLTLAISRARMRMRMLPIDASGWRLGTWYGMMMAGVAFHALVSGVPYAGSAAILSAWIFDLWKQRRSLRDVLRHEQADDVPDAGS